MKRSFYGNALKCLRKDFTLIELLIVIAIIAILASLLFPALGRTREAGRAVSCLGNVRQLASGALQYTDDFHGWIPQYSAYLRDGDWGYEIAPYVGAKVPTGVNSWCANMNGAWNAISKVFLCPSFVLGQATFASGAMGANDRKKDLLSGNYGINFNISYPAAGVNMQFYKIQRPSERFLIGDLQKWQDYGYDADVVSKDELAWRHPKNPVAPYNSASYMASIPIVGVGANVSFLDGHAIKAHAEEVPGRAYGVYFWGWYVDN